MYSIIIVYFHYPIQEVNRMEKYFVKMVVPSVHLLLSTTISQEDWPSDC